MSVGDAVRTKISHVEVTLKEADTENAVKAVVEVLKEIARALDALEASEKELPEAKPKEPWDYSKGIQHI